MRIPMTERVSGAIVLVLLVLFTALPFVALLSVALSPANTLPDGISFLRPLHWENFVIAFQLGNFPTLMVSSATLVVVVVPLVVLLSALGAYALTWLRLPLAGPIFLVFLAGLTIPTESLITPLYETMRGLHLTNTVWSVGLPLAALQLPFGIFWMRAHFQGMPAELEEAAQLDGSGPIRTFFRIQLPLARPAISTMVILSFLWTWNHFILTLVMIDDPAHRTVGGALAGFQGTHATDVVMLSAAALLMMIPTLLVFIIFQRQFAAALLQGSVKA